MAGKTGAEYEIRLSVKDGKLVVGQLNEVGAGGEKAFVRLHDASVSLDKSLSRLSGHIKSELLAVLGPAALEEAFRRSLDALQELQSLSETLDLPTEKIQELRYAAKQSGEDVSLMDQALVTFTKNLGEAQLGIGKLIPVFKDFGIQYKGLSAEKAFNNVVNAIKNATNAQDALTIATKAFGDDAGQKLVSLFREGTEGLAKFAQEAHNLGLIIDNELVKKAADGQKALQTIFYEISVYVQAAVAEIVSSVDDWADALSRAIAKAEALKDAFKQGGVMDGLKAYEDIINVTPSIEDKFSEDQSSLASRPIPTTGKKDSAPSNRMTDDDRKHGEAIQKQIEALQFRNNLMDKSIEQQEVYTELAKNQVDINSKQGQQIKNLVEKHIEMTRVQKLSNDLSASFGDNIADAVLNAQSLGDVLSNVGRSIQSTLLKSLMQPLTDMGSNFFGSMFKSFGFSEGGIMTHEGPIPLRKYAGGGIATGPQAAIFGEGSTPEAYVPVPSGRIPVELRGGMSAPAPQVKIEVINQTSQPVQASMKTGPGGNIKVMLKPLVKEMVREGELNKEMAAMYGLRPRTD